MDFDKSKVICTELEEIDPAKEYWYASSVRDLESYVLGGDSEVSYMHHKYGYEISEKLPYDSDYRYVYPFDADKISSLKVKVAWLKNQANYYDKCQKEALAYVHEAERNLLFWRNAIKQKIKVYLCNDSCSYKLETDIRNFSLYSRASKSRIYRELYSSKVSLTERIKNYHMIHKKWLSFNHDYVVLNTQYLKLCKEEEEIKKVEENLARLKESL